MLMLLFKLFCKFSSISFINSAERNFEIISHCNTPTSHVKRSDREPIHLTLSLILSYMDRIRSNNFSSIPLFIILNHRLVRETEWNAFFRPIKAKYNFFFACNSLSIKYLRINMASTMGSPLAACSVYGDLICSVRTVNNFHFFQTHVHVCLCIRGSYIRLAFVSNMLSS